ncbi:MAG: UDP-N-acetylmuramate--L-alanine ligase [Candidatus Kerfeldbacteria bacterium RIFCSPLOWO2_12_FULL_43_9]|nr:MAG: UDP-N-acetylmuramate--L-alanine ligase [Candidatus Kerfeldbacteria bacterium RIFCSPLOWO2_12_FULL_43_9]
MTFAEAHNIYCIGIGGIGMSALAQILHAQGKRVAGSDCADSQILSKLRSLGMTLHVPEASQHITQNVDLVIYSSAVPEEHEERQQARALAIPELSYTQALSELMRTYQVGTNIAGTNGKSTTTALIGLLAQRAGFDPTVVVGTLVKEWKSNARLGNNKQFLIAEACEHQSNFLSFDPQVIVLTNIEEDHLDYYHNLPNIINAFQRYIDKLPKHGWLVYNTDDSVSREKLILPKAQIRTYGIHHPADVMARSIVTLSGEQSFELWVGENYVEDFVLRVPGAFNISNALAAITWGILFGIKKDTMQSVFKDFSGTWRRFEILGTWKDARIISDYAHHPTAVTATIQATREFYPNNRIVVVFQPHQKHRTQVLFNKFVRSLKAADLVILPEIYYVAGREGNIHISSKDIARALEAEQEKDQKPEKKFWYANNLQETQKLMEHYVQKDDIVLMMGAGDIYTLAESLVIH